VPTSRNETKQNETEMGEIDLEAPSRFIRFFSVFSVTLTSTFFLYFWLTIQNTANRHVSNAFDLLAVFISFPLVRAAAAAAAAADF
jgi:hypothetical protein